MTLHLHALASRGPTVEFLLQFLVGSERFVSQPKFSFVNIFLRRRQYLRD